MRFVFKINSGYDGFRPQLIPERCVAPRLLELSWKSYIEAVDDRDEVWVFFRGPHAFEDGVYVKGRVARIDGDAEKVFLRIDEHNTEEPLLLDPEDAARVAELVDIRYRQVFLLPDELQDALDCTVASTALSCQAHRCEHCRVWRKLPRVAPEAMELPPRLAGSGCETYAAGFWTVPPRSFAYGYEKAGIRRTTEIFNAFKVGKKELAYPLALAMRKALRRGQRRRFDCLVPIPLSPDKAKRGELHRTKALADELSTMLGVSVRQLLSLKEAISKRALGLSAGPFEERYAKALEVAPAVRRYDRILLVDDTCTRGSTLKVAAERILELNSGCEVIAVTATLMAVKNTVADQDAVLA